MHPRDFQKHGPVQRRGRNSRGLGDMATPQRFESNPYDTMQLHTASRRAPRKSSSAWWLVPMLLIIVALAGALGGLTYLDQRYAGKIYPNVSVQGVDLTEMTAPEAEQALRK